MRSERSVRVRSDTPLPVRLVLQGEELGGFALPTCSIVVADQATGRWQIKAFAELVPGRSSLVGTILTVPQPTGGGRRERLVAQVSAPGAKGWMLEIEPFTGYAERAPDLHEAEIAIGACPDLLPPGVTAIAPWAEAVGERWRAVSGSLAQGSNSATVGNAGERVIAVSAYTAGSGATLAVTLPDGSAPQVKIPAAAAATMPIGGRVYAPIAFSVGGVDAQLGSWIVELAW